MENYEKIVSFILVLGLILNTTFTVDVLANQQNEKIHEVFVENNLVYIVGNEQPILNSTRNSTMIEDVDTYARDIVVLVPNDNTSAYEIAASIRKGNKEEATDSTISARATLKIYYEYRISVRNTETILLTKVEGSCYALDSYASIARQRVTYACNVPLGGGYQEGSYTPTPASWSKNTPSSWLPVETASSSPNACGARYELTLRRPNGYEWSFEILNNILNGSIPGIS